jgi:hypothetical protein
MVGDEVRVELAIDAQDTELLALGPLIVAVGKVTGTLAGVVRTLQGWVGRKPGLRVRLEIDGDVLELSRATAGQQLVADEWLARHPPGELLPEWHPPS